MFAYLLLSLLLSALSAGLYWAWFRGRFTASQLKKLLLHIPLWCLILPLFLPLSDTKAAFEQAPPFSNYQGWNVVDLADPQLQHCYQQALAQGSMCQCEVAQQAKILQYQPHRAYRLWNQLEKPLYLVFGLLASVLILHRLLLYLSLSWLVAQSQIQANHQGDPSWHWLLPPKHYALPLGAFSLGKRNYIIQPPYWHQLQAQEQNQILKHEIAHLQAGDSRWSFLWHCLACCWFWNPFFWHFQREWSYQAELQADLLAQEGQGKSYCQLLLKIKLLEQKMTKHSLLQHLAQHLLTQRIRYLRQAAPQPRKGQFLLSYTLTFVLLFLSLLPSQQWLQQQKKAYHQYQILEQQYLQTGYAFFCVDCLPQTGAKDHEH